ncbi:hypothetical protein [Lederbergia graminis]|uniref:Uncharacterized protein n=1 Tax=Lederbergia graminis TaxID=735518 RepID=A0ABW0LL16_9BACI
MKKNKKKWIKWGVIGFAILIVLSLMFGGDTEDKDNQPSELEKRQAERAAEREERQQAYEQKQAERKKEKAEEEAKKAEEEAQAAKEMEQYVADFEARFEDFVSKNGEGVILGIGPVNGTYTQMKMVVSDAWYNSPAHEKERFAKSMKQYTLGMLRQTKVIDTDDDIVFRIVDAYGKTVAESTWTGEMKIKN